MVEKIVVTRDEVIHFPWLDTSWVYVYFTQDDVTKHPFFSRMLIAALRHGIRETTGQDFKDMTVEENYLFVKYNSNDIIPILKNACDWLVKNVQVKDPTNPKSKFFLDHKDLYLAFLSETKTILEEKKYIYYFQRVDGMN